MSLAVVEFSLMFFQSVILRLLIHSFFSLKVVIFNNLLEAIPAVTIFKAHYFKFHKIGVPYISSV